MCNSLSDKAKESVILDVDRNILFCALPGSGLEELFTILKRNPLDLEVWPPKFSPNDTDPRYFSPDNYLEMDGKALHNLRVCTYSLIL